MDADSLQLVLYLLMGCAALGFTAWRKRREKANLALYEGLREIFYTTAPEDMLGSAPLQPGAVVGVAMDWPIKDTQATVIACTDGTGSIYMKKQGSAICGAYGAADLARDEHPPFQHGQPIGPPRQQTPEPDPATVYFYIRTTDALYRVSDSASALLVGKGAAEPLFAAGNDLMTALFKMADTAEKVPE